MDFFDKLGKKASQTYKGAAEKTSRLAKEAKLRMKINELKSEINELYKEIGKKVYEKHVREENIDIKRDLEEKCTKIDVLSTEIETSLKECLSLKDKKQCIKCYKEIEKDAKFCQECGAKQNEEEPAKDAQIVEKLEETAVDDDNSQEKQIVIENLNNENSEEKNKSNNQETTLEKTVAIESGIDTQENFEDE